MFSTLFHILGFQGLFEIYNYWMPLFAIVSALLLFSINMLLCLILTRFVL